MIQKINVCIRYSGIVMETLNTVLVFMLTYAAAYVSIR